MIVEFKYRIQLVDTFTRYTVDYFDINKNKTDITGRYVVRVTVCQSKMSRDVQSGCLGLESGMYNDR